MEKPQNTNLSEPKIIDIYNKKQGYWYVYSNQSYWDSEKKQTRHVRHTIGKRLTADGPIIYNNRFKSEQPSAALEKAEISSTELLGETLVLDAIVKELGLKKHLTAAFSKDKAEMVIGLAEYLICTKRAPSWSGDWAAYRNPKIAHLTSQSVSELLSSLSRDKRNTFFSRWMQANTCEKGYFCFDSTNIGGYNTETNPLVEYGYTHGHISLPQANLAILARQDTLVPIHSLVYAGSRHDSTTLQNLVDELEKLQLNSICITLDKGYYSEKNLELLRKKGYDFIICIPRRVSWQYEIIDSLRDSLYTLEARTPVGDPDGDVQIIQCIAKPVTRNGHRYYLHVVYNPAIRADAEKDFIELLATCKKELEENQYVSSHEKLYEQFFEVRDTPKRGRKVLERGASIAQFQQSYAGYWCLLTNRKRPKEEIYAAYQQRNTAEIFYDTFKNDLQGNRITDHKLESYEGKMFVLFIALAILTRLKSKLIQKKTGNKVLKRLKTYAQLLFRMSTLAKVSFKGKYKPIYSTPTKLQREIINSFDLDWPH
ncbi:MAG: transposase [Sphaerochaetaceae bacterium]|jgi:transposase|nr:transposase [Sphaerochaetaceae bacterium]